MIEHGQHDARGRDQHQQQQHRDDVVVQHAEVRVEALDQAQGGERQGNRRRNQGAGSRLARQPRRNDDPQDRSGTTEEHAHEQEGE